MLKNRSERRAFFAHEVDHSAKRFEVARWDRRRRRGLRRRCLRARRNTESLRVCCAVRRCGPRRRCRRDVLGCSWTRESWRAGWLQSRWCTNDWWRHRLCVARRAARRGRRSLAIRSAITATRRRSALHASSRTCGPRRRRISTTRAACNQTSFEICEPSQQLIHGDQRRAFGETNQRHLESRARLAAPCDVVKRS